MPNILKMDQKTYFFAIAQWLTPVNVIYLFSHTNYVIFGTVVLDNVPVYIHCMHVHLYWFEHFILIYILVLKR